MHKHENLDDKKKNSTADQRIDQFGRSNNLTQHKAFAPPTETEDGIKMPSLGGSAMPPTHWNETKMPTLGGVATPLQQKRKEGTIQEKTDSNSMPAQLLKKTNHPWTGTVVNAGLLAMRDAPRGNTLADLPDRTLVDVTGTSGNWLEMQVDTSQAGIVMNGAARSRLSGSTLDGFSDHRHIDDAAAAEMTNMLGEEATWQPSGANMTAAAGGGRQSTTFDAWASATSEGTAPPVNAVTTINCWEMILLAAYRIGAADWNWIHQLYTNPQPSNRAELNQWYVDLPVRITNGGLATYDTTTKTPLPQRGDIVFFDGASHVALATGNADEILTFWPPPNTTFTPGGTVDDVKTSSIEALVDWMVNDPRFPATPSVVTYGSPQW